MADHVKSVKGLWFLGKPLTIFVPSIPVNAKHVFGLREARKVFEGVLAARTATVTSTPQSNRFNEPKQSFCTCVLYGGKVFFLFA